MKLLSDLETLEKLWNWKTPHNSRMIYLLISWSIHKPEMSLKLLCSIVIKVPLLLDPQFIGFSSPGFRIHLSNKFPEKIVDFFGWNTRENVVVLDFLAVDNFDFTRKIVLFFFGWKTRENVEVLSKKSFWTKIWLFG